MATVEAPAEVVEIADLSKDPVCAGSRLIQWDGEITEEPCDKAAIGRKITKHCGRRVTLMCGEHHADDVRRPTTCRVCRTPNVPTDWLSL